MRAPGPLNRPKDEVVEDLVRKLTDRKNRIEIAADVRDTANQLLKLRGPLWGNKSTNLDFLNRLRGWVEKLQTTLAAAPSAANTIKLCRLIEKLEKTLKGVPEGIVFGLFAREEVLTAGPEIKFTLETIDAYGAEAEARWERFATEMENLHAALKLGLRGLCGGAVRELEVLRNRCDRLVTETPR